jgi:hypothetical protein
LEFVHTSDARQSALENALNELASQFEVSHETAAWQVKNSGALPEKYDDILRPFLKSLWKPD